jgi:hypothetical protein
MTKAKRFNIIQAISHPDLFGSLPALHSLETWAAWITWLKAVFALPMDEKELAIYQQRTGRSEPPTKQDCQDGQLPDFSDYSSVARYLPHYAAKKRQGD